MDYMRLIPTAQKASSYVHHFNLVTAMLMDSSRMLTGPVTVHVSQLNESALTDLFLRYIIVGHYIRNFISCRTEHG
jgi:hypothetical protein